MFNPGYMPVLANTRWLKKPSKITRPGGSALSIRFFLALPGPPLDTAVNEVWLFHGTHPIAVDKITADNFSVNLAGSSTGTLYGRGLYFAEACSKADEYAEDDASGIYKGLYAMLLCRVTLGKTYYTDAVRVDGKMLMDSCIGPAASYHSVLGDREKAIGLTGIKHPTSGMLAIDHFLNLPNVSLPVYIHGFDFFEGPEIHYYNKTEPLYERINDMIGVNTMHQPEKEKAFVALLVKEGKVKWLKDLKEEK